MKINNDKIRIRPSSVDSFFSCAYKWGSQHLEGVTGTPNSRACLGTAIHSAAENIWTEAMASGKKDSNVPAAVDAAMESWKEQTHDGVSYDKDETEGTVAVEIFKGTESFVEDILPFTKIPNAVEEFFSIPIDHPMVSEVAGTLDYRSDNTIGDLKTGKRKTSAQAHTTQQSIYKMLAQANGKTVEHNLIQNVVLKKSGVEGSILTLMPNIEQAKARINIILDTLDLVHKDIAPIETILRPNPNQYLCDARYCPVYPCHAVKDL